MFVALGACGFGAISIFVAIATKAGAPLLDVLYWRYMIAALVLLFVLVRSGGRPDRRDDSRRGRGIVRFPIQPPRNRRCPPPSRFALH